MRPVKRRRATILKHSSELQHLVSPEVIRSRPQLPSGRRQARQHELDFRSPAGLAVEIDPAAQTVGDDTVDDMQAKAGAAQVATRREKRIESLAPDTVAHAAAVVG